MRNLRLLSALPGLVLSGLVASCGQTSTAQSPAVAGETCASLRGSWRWFDQGRVEIAADGRVQWYAPGNEQPGHSARVSCDAATGTATLAWTNGYTDVIPALDGAYLQGRNNVGMTIWANRITAQGTAQRTPGPTPMAAPVVTAPPTPTPPSLPGPPPQCPSTIAAMDAIDDQSLPPMMLVEGLAKAHFDVDSLPASLRGSLQPARIETGPDQDGACAHVTVNIGGTRASIEYVVYGALAAPKPVPFDLAGGAGHQVIETRTYNDDAIKECHFYRRNGLHIGCMWGDGDAFDKSRWQVVAIGRNLATSSGRDDEEIEQTRQLAEAGQRHALGVGLALMQEKLRQLMQKLN